jgi:hypothetical protein
MATTVKIPPPDAVTLEASRPLHSCTGNLEAGGHGADGVSTACFFYRGEGHEITREPRIETKLQALIRLEVACQLAIDSLPDLPLETGERLRDPIQSNPSAI